MVKPRDPNVQLVSLLAFQSIDLVIDVGANRGQYASRLRGHGYDKRICSVEPIAEIHEALRRIAEPDPLWSVLPPMALGSAPGEAALEISAESDMSSILAQNRFLRDRSPSSAIERREMVRLERLDRLDDALPSFDRALLKIDVQGYEPEVLAGAEGVMDRIVAIQLEMALLPLYEGERDYRWTLQHMAERGYELFLLIPGYFDPKLARQIQCDGVFVHRELGR
ncbi:MAG: FkbM family methyltransferase [Geminicoccaceae bacterium]